ncbi:hypothetical protein CC77DRAFT_707854 [Alternaria alternata]|uniref:Uncharacterized protein n=1 Tax=Alternaria alternata TaxID=5599 RepID=A0A177DU78_ALTAL|nr:hypothetical protein CC77DRAFT_707854 [Alternaria alternata]OAG23295.1 hypothetical protein CC77DRAFT_707854 [Alternaria alternata]CAI9636821.1 unnamed protein product [Alternaria burnsii]
MPLIPQFLFCQQSLRRCSATFETHSTRGPPADTSLKGFSSRVADCRTGAVRDGQRLALTHFEESSTRAASIQAISPE